MLPVTKVREKYVVAGIGESGMIACEATGVPTPNITWTRWGTNQPLPSTTGTVVGGAYSNLTIIGSLETAGEYVCAARIQTGEMSNASVFFSVECKQTFYD